MSLQVVFWDVKHGSSTYIKTPNGKHILVDLGVGSYESNNDVFSPILHLKQKWNVQQLDKVIITHPHKDHIDDMLNFDVLSPKSLHRPSVNKEEIMKNVQSADKPIFEKYFQIDARYSCPMSAENDLSIQNSAGSATIQTFWPQPKDVSNINNLSIVTVVSYATSKIVITGDNEAPSWEQLLSRTDFVESIKGADILLASHHGRESGFYQDLFKHFQPYITVISDGRFCETSATGRYCAVTKGWPVRYRDGSSEGRKCLATRNDGYIVVNLGYNANNQPTIGVSAKGK